MRLPAFPGGARGLSRARSLLAGALALGAAGVLVSRLGAVHPVEEWLFFDLARIWLWDLYLSAACAAAGHLIVERLLPERERTPLETLALAFPAGLVAFILGMYLGGFLHLYGPVFAVALPLALLAAGAPAGLRALGRARAEAAAVAAAGGRGWRPLQVVASLFGIAALGVLYLGVMSPDAVNYDASWNHLVIAQDYAREGRIVPFPGDWVKNLPHLGSIVNAWAFMVPGLPLPQLHWMMALHTEFTVLIWTLVGVAGVASWLTGRRVSGAWAMTFLFPALFVYDSNLGAAADHYLAVFAAPMFLAGAHAARNLDRRACILWGLLIGGGFLTKVHALYIAAPMAALAVGRGVQLVARRARGDAGGPSYAAVLGSLLAVAGTTLVVMSPHLIGHAIFFKNPVYPLLQNVFTASTPAVRDAAQQIDYLFVDWRWHPPRVLGERLTRAVELAFTFSFVPHYSFVNNLPVFGSLFTLSLPLLLAIPRGGRARLAAGVGMVALFTWAFTFAVDRNLQTFMPLLAASTAATLILAWELGGLARAGVAVLVLVQLAWATPLYFSGADRMNGALALLKSGMEGRSRERLRSYRAEHVALGKSLPKKAKVLLHDQHIMLGIDRPVLLDWIGFQGIIDYREFKTPRDLWERLHALGVTHVVWGPGSRTASSKQEEIIFAAFADQVGHPSQPFGGLQVFPLPATPPPARPGYKVLVSGVWGYADGLYPVESLSACEEYPPRLQVHPGPEKTAGSPFEMVDQADVILLGAQSIPDAAASERLNREFRQLSSHASVRVMMRR